jgi:hypothetical protein
MYLCLFFPPDKTHVGLDIHKNDDEKPEPSKKRKEIEYTKRA